MADQRKGEGLSMPGAGPLLASSAGKRRARSNRIGATGGAAFRYFSSQAGLLPTKLEDVDDSSVEASLMMKDVSVISAA